jgi:hypothetical protein
VSERASEREREREREGERETERERDIVRNYSMSRGYRAAIPRERGARERLVA